MSQSYMCLDACHLLVSEENLEAAINVFGEENAKANLKSNGLWGIQFSGESPWDGYNNYAADEAAEFIEKYCEPGSYASFYNYDYGDYTFDGKDADGNMVSRCLDRENPFYDMMVVYERIGRSD